MQLPCKCQSPLSSVGWDTPATGEGHYTSRVDVGLAEGELLPVIIIRAITVINERNCISPQHSISIFGDTNIPKRQAPEVCFIRNSRHLLLQHARAGHSPYGKIQGWWSNHNHDRQGNPGHPAEGLHVSGVVGRPGRVLDEEAVVDLGDRLSERHHSRALHGHSEVCGSCNIRVLLITMMKPVRSSDNCQIQGTVFDYIPMSIFFVWRSPTIPDQVPSPLLAPHWPSFGGART